MGIALDTNIFIYALERQDTSGDQARNLLRGIEREKSKGSISSIVFEEFFIKVYKSNLKQKIPYLIDYLTLKGLFNVIDVTQKVALLAANLRAKYPSLRAPDALHLASALEARASVFITSDKKLPRKVGKLTVKVLS